MIKSTNFENRFEKDSTRNTLYLLYLKTKNLKKRKYSNERFEKGIYFLIFADKYIFHSFSFKVNRKQLNYANKGTVLGK